MGKPDMGKKRKEGGGEEREKGWMNGWKEERRIDAKMRMGGRSMSTIFCLAVILRTEATENRRSTRSHRTKEKNNGKMLAHKKISSICQMFYDVCIFVVCSRISDSLS